MISGWGKSFPVHSSVKIPKYSIVHNHNLQRFSEFKGFRNRISSLQPSFIASLSVGNNIYIFKLTTRNLPGTLYPRRNHSAHGTLSHECSSLSSCRLADESFIVHLHIPHQKRQASSHKHEAYYQAPRISQRYYVIHGGVMESFPVS